MLDKALLAVLPHVPRPLLWPIARRYVAGTTLAQALDVLRELAALGHPGIIDILGEDVTGPEAARAVGARVRRGCRRRGARAGSTPTSRSSRRTSACASPRAWRSSSTGSSPGAASGTASSCASRWRITRPPTRRCASSRRLHAEHPNIGIVLQSRLLRTPADIERLTRSGAGARRAPGQGHLPRAGRDRPHRARADPRGLRGAARARCSSAARASPSRRTTTGLAQSAWSSWCASSAWRASATSSRCCSACASALWRQWRAAGHTVRVYVPFGPEWRPYSLRRLRKNPRDPEARRCATRSGSADARRGLTWGSLGAHLRSLADRQAPREHLGQHARVAGSCAASSGSRRGRGAR